VKSYVAKSSSQKEEVKDVAFEGLQIVAPPLPFAELMDVYEANSILQKCIEFRAQNVVSAGWEIIAEDKENAKEDEKKEIEQFFETCNNEKTFEEIVRDQLIDEYTGGSGAIEVAREGLDGESRVKGKPSKLFNVPIATVRVAKGKNEEG